MPCLSTWERGQSPLHGVEGDLRVQEPCPSPTISWKQFLQRPLPVETQILTSLTQPHRPVPPQNHQLGLTRSFPEPVRTWACDPLVLPAQPQLQPLSLPGQKPPLTAPLESGPVVHMVQHAIRTAFWADTRLGLYFSLSCSPRTGLVPLFKVPSL